MTKQNTLWKDTRGYAVVEATILFPIIMMVFAGLFLLSIYLPTRSVLQQATQYAATAIATEQADTWLKFDETSMEYKWLGGSEKPPNVYVALISSFFKGDVKDKADKIVTKLSDGAIIKPDESLKVDCVVNNYVVYKEIVVTATHTIPVPVDLSLVGFPEKIPITVWSTAVVQNGDEFVRNMDLGAEFVAYLLDKYDIKFSALSECINQCWEFLGV